MASDDTKPTLIEGYTYAAGDYPPEPTKPAVLSAARLAEIRERVSYTVIAEGHNEAIADRAALLRYLDALAAGPVPASLYSDLNWAAKSDGEARSREMVAAAYVRGRAAGRAEGEAERALLREALATSTAELAEARADQQKLIDECARKNETIGKLTNERERAHRDEKQRIVDAIQARLDEESVPDAEGAFCEALAIARNGEGDLSPAEDHTEALAAARIEGARVEREALDLYLLAAYQETGYEGPVASALSDALDWLRARGAGGAG